MSSFTQVRPDTQAALVAELDSRLTGVNLMDGVNARDIENETIAVGDVRTSGPSGLIFMQAGRKQRVDQFSFDVEFWSAADHHTPAEAKARVAEMFSALEDLLAEQAAFNGLQWVQISSFTGPNSIALDTNFAGQVIAQVECKAQLI